MLAELTHQPDESLPGFFEVFYVDGDLSFCVGDNTIFWAIKILVDLMLLHVSSFNDVIVNKQCLRLKI